MKIHERQMIQKLLTNKTFKLFLEDITALGFTVSASPKAEALPYGIIGGRSNHRWWLIPLTNRHVATSSLALFQPILPSAKILKNFASVLNYLGLSTLWAQNKVYINCPSIFSDLFDTENFSYAFFTGTKSPHRKTTIQIMDNIGKIKGFAKLSKQQTVKQLINYEGNFIKYAHSLKLKNTYIPRNLFNNEINDAAVLVTDTLKTKSSRSPVAFTKHHHAFLKELANKSTNGEQLQNSNFLKKIKKQAEQLAPCLPEEWNKRLARAIKTIDQEAPRMEKQMITCHGDFTPWNTFIVNDKLYVFDWEYAMQGCSPGYDLIHFHLSLPKTKRQSGDLTIRQIRELLIKNRDAKNDIEADTLFLCYLCENTLLYAGREYASRKKIEHWDSEYYLKSLTDKILE